MLHFDHNHNYFSARSLAHNMVSDKAEANYIQLLKNGAGVTEAYTFYRTSVMQQHINGDFTYGDQRIESILADSSICPTERQVWYIFAKYNEIQ
jgi:hypothetical protein